MMPLKRPWLAVVFVACLFVIAPAQAPPRPTAACPENHHEIPRGAIKVPLPDVRQGDNYSCGVAALMSILAYYGVGPEDYGVLKKKLGTTTRDGTNFRRMVKFAGLQGLQAEARPEMKVEQLERCLDRGRPVICSIQAYDEDEKRSPVARRTLYREKDENGHYVVAIGYDRDNLYFMDPSLDGRRGYLPKGEFEERWHDNEGTEKKPHLLRHLGLVIWKEGGKSACDHRARKID